MMLFREVRFERSRTTADPQRWLEISRLLPTAGLLGLAMCVVLGTACSDGVINDITGAGDNDCAVGGCGDDGPGDSSTGDSSTGDSSTGDSGAGDTTCTGIVDINGCRCAGGTWWDLTFDSDPTQLDVNDDGTADWYLRDGQSFAISELENGVWRTTSGTPLDSGPDNPFALPTTVSVRLRNTTVGGRGAVFWINADHTTDSFASIVISVALQAGGTQRLVLNAVDDTGDVEIVQLDGLTADFIDVDLDIDSDNNTVSLWVGGTLQGTFAYPQRSSPHNPFASLLGWGSVAEFDALRIESCADRLCPGGTCPTDVTVCSSTNHTGVCPAGLLCDAGNCTRDTGCVSGLVMCGGDCIDPATSRTYCGASGDCLTANAGQACAGNESCSDGTCTVIAGGDAPVFGAIGHQTVWADHLLTFSVSATDPQNDPLTFTAAGLPSGASFDVSTQIFSWTPSAAQVGDHSVEITVSDQSSSDWESVLIRVLAGGPSTTCTTGLIVPDAHSNIQAAVDAAGSGSVVCVRAATYRETVTIGNSGAAGSPLVLQAYPGDEGQVVIDASDPVSGWSDLGSGLYRAAVPSRVRQLFKDGVPLDRSRYPTSGYRFPTSIDSPTRSTALYDTGLPGGDDHWVGARIHILTQYWDINHQTVTGFVASSGLLTFTELSRNQVARTTFGYYLTNIVGEIAADGEWAYKDGYVYLMSSGGSPTGITRSARSNAIKIAASQSFVEVYGMVVRYAAASAINVPASSDVGSSDIVIADNRIEYSFGDAIHSYGAGSRHTIVRNTIYVAGPHGIYVNKVRDSLVAYNVLYAIGAEQLGGDIYSGAGTGIELTTSPGTVILANRVDRTAYCGISVINWWIGHDRDVAYNHITNTMLSLDDGGGIYMMSGHTGNETPDTWDRIHHNIVEESFGYYEGTPRAGQPRTSKSQSVGIYVDSTSTVHSHRTRVSDNTAIGNYHAGIFSHDSLQFEAFDNTLFDNENVQMLVTNDDYPGADDAGARNIMFATTTSQHSLRVRGAPELGAWDDNIFYGGGNSQHIMHKEDGDYLDYSLAQWRALSGEEANGVEVTTPAGAAQIFINPTLSSVQVGLQGQAYNDLNGNPVTGAILLGPFESRILTEQ